VAVSSSHTICWDIDAPAENSPCSGEKLGETTSVPSRGSVTRVSAQNRDSDFITGYARSRRNVSSPVNR
jgi:hypothetical protein